MTYSGIRRLLIVTFGRFLTFSFGVVFNFLMLFVGFCGLAPLPRAGLSFVRRVHIKLMREVGFCLMWGRDKTHLPLLQSVVNQNIQI